VHRVDRSYWGRAVTAVGFAVLAMATVGTGTTLVEQTPINVRVFADTGVKLTDVLWTGTRFLYLENTANTVWSAGPAGAPVQKFASMPRRTEETRCRLSPGAHGFAPGAIYCHAPGNTIYRISADGAKVTTFAHLPETTTADGALAFDTAGRFGYDLIAATGRSGKANPAHASVYAISPSGHTRLVADYDAIGGADEVMIAPKSFGTAGGAAILTVDAGSTGDVIAVGPDGLVRRIARLPDGPNPIVAIPTNRSHGGEVPPGLYLTDTNSRKVFFASATQLARYAGDLVVGTELKGELWVVRPYGDGFVTRLLRTNLPSAKYNLEGATYVAG
jgi:hypothetical protein